MLIHQPVATKGWINKVVTEESKWKISGWLITNSPIVEWQLQVGGQPITNFQVEAGLASPRIHELFPQLASAENARFKIYIDQAAVPQAKDRLITVQPVTAAGRGQPLFALIEPSLPMPSQEDMYTIGGAFLNVALEFLGYLVDKAGLKPTDAVLDVGCGVGRMAYVLTYYLHPQARYEGFDIIENLITWAREHISARSPNFQFQKVDLHNTWYNPEGKASAQDFIFPYPDQSFDVVFLTSVFTHLRGYEVCHYIDEIKRVLKPGGRCLVTCFLLNEESEQLIIQEKSSQQIIYDLGDCWTSNKDQPENATGFVEPVFLNWWGSRGFWLLHNLYGSWCGRSHYTSYQDILVWQKPSFWQKIPRKISHLLQKIK